MARALWVQPVPQEHLDPLAQSALMVIVVRPDPPDSREFMVQPAPQVVEGMQELLAVLEIRGQLEALALQVQPVRKVISAQLDKRAQPDLLVIQDPRDLPEQLVQRAKQALQASMDRLEQRVQQEGQEL